MSPKQVVKGQQMTYYDREVEKYWDGKRVDLDEMFRAYASTIDYDIEPKLKGGRKVFRELAYWGIMLAGVVVEGVDKETALKSEHKLSNGETYTVWKVEVGARIWVNILKQVLRVISGEVYAEHVLQMMFGYNLSGSLVIVADDAGVDNLRLVKTALEFMRVTKVKDEDDWWRGVVWLLRGLSEDIDPMGQLTLISGEV